jgi:hypothetical protein
MSAQAQDNELVDNVNRILERSFDDIRKRVLALVTKREKKLVRDATASTRTSKAPSKKREEAPRKKRDTHRKSESSSSE